MSKGHEFEAGSGVYQSCDKEFYKDYTGDEACTPCPDGCTTERAGSEKASDCMYSSHL